MNYILGHQALREELFGLHFVRKESGFNPILSISCQCSKAQENFINHVILKCLELLHTSNVKT
jgi:hypothetical protein